MFSIRKFALVPVLAVAALGAVAQSSSSSNSQPDQAQKPQVSVQERIRARREVRRKAAIREVYSHLYDAYVGGGYVRTNDGPSLQRVNEYSWNVGVTRYYTDHLGLDVEGRGYYGTAYTYQNVVNISKPAISQYQALAGPQYRFLMNPKYSVSARVLGGFAHGNFGADTNGVTPTTIGLYPSANTYALVAGVPVDYNLTPAVALRVAPEFVSTGYGSTQQASFGFSYGFVVRFGKR